MNTLIPSFVNYTARGCELHFLIPVRAEPGEVSVNNSSQLLALTTVFSTFHGRNKQAAKVSVDLCNLGGSGRITQCPGATAQGRVGGLHRHWIDSPSILMVLSAFISSFALAMPRQTSPLSLAWSIQPCQQIKSSTRFIISDTISHWKDTHQLVSTHATISWFLIPFPRLTGGFQS